MVWLSVLEDSLDRGFADDMWVGLEGSLSDSLDLFQECGNAPHDDLATKQFCDRSYRGSCLSLSEQ